MSCSGGGMPAPRPRFASYFLGLPGALRVWKWFSHSKARLALADMRQEYALAGLAEADAPADDPWPLWTKWFEEAVKSGIREPNALVVSTAATTGQVTDNLRRTVAASASNMHAIAIPAVSLVMNMIPAQPPAAIAHAALPERAYR